MGGEQQSMQSYPGFAPSVNMSLPAVSTGAAAFFRWVANWHDQTGDVWAATPYLARKSRRSEPTIYRWLAELRRGGYIRCDVVPGVERRIIPLVAPDVAQLARDAKRGEPRVKARAIYPYKKTSKQVPQEKKMRGVVRGVVRGVIPNSARVEEKTTTAQPGANSPSPAACVAQADCSNDAAVAALISHGVHAPIARRLVAEFGPQKVEEQIAALPWRKAESSGAVLVVATKSDWPIPRRCSLRQIAAQKVQDRKDRQEAKQRAEAAVRARRASEQAELESRLAGMSSFERERLEKQAAGLWQSEQPGAFAVMSGRLGGAVVLREYMARILLIATSAGGS